MRHITKCQIMLFSLKKDNKHSTHTNMDKPKRWVKNVTKKCNPMAGFVHDPKLG